MAQELGVPIEKIEVIHSDSHGVPYAQGSYGSRTFSVEGAAIYEAAQKFKQKATKVGAHLLGVRKTDVGFADGKVVAQDRSRRGQDPPGHCVGAVVRMGLAARALNPVSK